MRSRNHREKINEIILLKERNIFNQVKLFLSTVIERQKLMDREEWLKEARKLREIQEIIHFLKVLLRDQETFRQMKKIAKNKKDCLKVNRKVVYSHGWSSIAILSKIIYDLNNSISFCTDYIIVSNINQLKLLKSFIIENDIE